MMSVYACPLFCICLSPIRIILTWPVILIYLSYFTAAAPGGATTTGIKCSYPFFSSIRISPEFSLLSKLNIAEKNIPHFIRDPCFSPQYWVYRASINIMFHVCQSRWNRQTRAMIFCTIRRIISIWLFTVILSFCSQNSILRRKAYLI